jgi:hypothetical protein
LALAGEAARRSGESAAASDYFLRAGRSAAAQGNAEMARPWLQRAVELAPDQPVGIAANELLRTLDRSHE